MTGRRISKIKQRKKTEMPLERIYFGGKIRSFAIKLYRETHVLWHKAGFLLYIYL